MSQIVNFYIEVNDDADQVRLERTINASGFAFYDATAFDPLIPKNPTLECIEADLECK